MIRLLISLLTGMVVSSEILNLITNGSLHGFLSYQEANTLLDSLISRFPNLLTREVIGKSYKGVDILAYRLFNSFQSTPIDVPKVLMTSLMHAREPASLSVVLGAIALLIDEYSKNVTDTRFLLCTRELYFVPFVNPDGYMLANDSVPSNRRKNARETCPTNPGEGGVDLNRNFDSHWDNSTYGGCSEEYAGIAPFSEPETLALKLFAEKKRFVSALNFHAYGNFLTYPFNYNSTRALSSVHEQFYGEIQSIFKFVQAGPAGAILGYNTGGESDDWFYEKLQTLSMSPEVGREEDGFTPPPERLKQLVSENYARIKYWLFKAGCEISKLRVGVEGANLIFSAVNTGLGQCRQVGVVIQMSDCSECGLNPCQVISPGLRMYSPSSNWTMAPLSEQHLITIPACTVSSLSNLARVCLVQAGLNCRCFDLQTMSPNISLGIMSNQASNHQVCEGAGVAQFVAVDELGLGPVYSIGMAGTSRILIVLIFLLVGAALFRIVKKSLSLKQHATYDPVVQEFELETIARF